MKKEPIYNIKGFVLIRKQLFIAAFFVLHVQCLHVAYIHNYNIFVHYHKMDYISNLPNLQGVTVGVDPMSTYIYLMEYADKIDKANGDEQMKTFVEPMLNQFFHGIKIFLAHTAAVPSCIGPT